MEEYGRQEKIIIFWRVVIVKHRDHVFKTLVVVADSVINIIV